MNSAPTLENERVILSPLTIDNFEKLISVASQENLVQYSPSDIASAESLKNYVVTALEQQKAGTSIPFIVYDREYNAFAGCTRFMNINLKNKVLHIGSTWIGREFQSSGLNTQMKKLMFEHAFTTMNFEKVEFRVDERNLASRKAVEKLGCTLEGILRKDVYLLNGFKRNTCCYGLLREEWQTNNN
ncbi:RimJ/RimL family protein N-acetyltransferase [Maribacter spongiicola]|uniref:RimJ/RimL family protein N-acetyltransferase n=1 Tax=Maribacter spongiicola TaxID=1206753 RepID=A0A4R7K404_9FLAO|nr:GNAT family protein [Maribacter spongiicola]TDT44837.1 RimJ/RimL family protein N-acetyltransferase [Maribacter spongiicola]